MVLSQHFNKQQLQSAIMFFKMLAAAVILASIPGCQMFVMNMAMARDVILKPFFDGNAFKVG